jgi:hypothetical protein
MIRPLILLACTGLACTALPAGAACPVASDLGKGIRFTLTDGSTETFTAETPGLVTSFFDADGVQTRTLLVQGLYTVEVMAFDNGQPLPASRVTISFTDPRGGRPAPAEGATWNGTFTTLDGSRIVSETESFTFGAPRTESIGTCTFHVLPVRVDYPDRSPRYHEEMTWFTDLGFAYLSATVSEGTDPVRSDYVAVEVLD